MKKNFLFLLLFLVIYMLSLSWKAAQIEERNKQEQPTLYSLWQKNGVPVYAFKAKTKQIKKFELITGIFKNGRLIAKVPQQTANKISIHSKVKIHTGNKTLNGRISYISNESNIYSGLNEIQISTQSNQLEENQFYLANVEIETSSPQIIVPKLSISTRENVPYVFVVTPNNILEKRPVVLGNSTKDIQIIKSGIKPGEMIVSSDSRYLKNNQRVEVIKVTKVSHQ